MRIILVLFILSLNACHKHMPAPVEDANNARNKSLKSSHSSVKYRPQTNPDYVEVQKGDSLYSIGFSHNIDYKSLARINKIPAPYRIYPGQLIKLKADENYSRIVSNDVVKTTPIKINKPIKSHVVKPTKPIVKTAKVVKKPIIKSTHKVSKPVKVVKNVVTKKPTSKPKSKPTIVKLKPAPSSNSRWIWPVRGKVISTFSHSDSSRKGIDIASPIGKPVYASNNGSVVYSGDGLRGYGELIILKHSNNLLSAYAHNSVRLVKEGDIVQQGDAIAKSGKGNDGTGLLHFEIRLNGQPVNPIKYLPKK